MRNIHTDKPEHEDDIYTGDFKDIPELQEKKLHLATLFEIDKPQFFKQFAHLVLSLADKGKITRQTAAYKIAGWMSDEDLKAIPEIEEIVMFAGQLELPYHRATAEGTKNSYNKAWRELQKMLQRLILDATLPCSYCNNPFIFTAEEQVDYASKGSTYAPNRCPPCRDLHKTQVDHTAITCEVCGTE